MSSTHHISEWPSFLRTPECDELRSPAQGADARALHLVGRRDPRGQGPGGPLLLERPALWQRCLRRDPLLSHAARPGDLPAARSHRDRLFVSAAITASPFATRRRRWRRPRSTSHARTRSRMGTFAPSPSSARGRSLSLPRKTARSTCSLQLASSALTSAKKGSVAVCGSPSPRGASFTTPCSPRPSKRRATMRTACSRLTKRSIADYDDAILLNQDGTVAEATGENVFFVKGKELVTNDATSSILPGLTRDTVLTLAAEANIVDARARIHPRRAHGGRRGVSHRHRRRSHTGPRDRWTAVPHRTHHPRHQAAEGLSGRGLRSQRKILPLANELR